MTEREEKLPDYGVRGVTPLMTSYVQMKRSLGGGVLVLLRLGDFYEALGDDARTVSQVCNVTLTKRNDTLMAGVPYHSKDHYVKMLVKAGYKVALVERKERTRTGALDAARIITPPAGELPTDGQP